MKDDDSIFGASPERFDRFIFEAWQNPDVDEQDAPTLAAQMLSEQLGGQIGRYKLLSILGEGGMGIVYLAEQERPVRRQVALKVIKPGMDSKRVLARFEAEQQALAMMEHPHVARVHDAGLTPSGRPYFIMEHVKGVPITEYCDKHRLTVEERLRLFLHVCEAVQHAHQKGVIHRDLKPSNILVTIEDEAAVPKVIDFGVARAVTQPLTERTLHTEQGQLVGTPEYMSPEQADLSNQDIDTRTDVYSLGVVLYELIAGVLPFDSHTLREHGIDGARKVICEQEPQTPSTRLTRTSVEESTKSAQCRKTNVRQLQRRLRGDLDWITLKAMEKDRTRRYASAGELAADVLRHLNHEPVTAGRPNPAYKARKFVRRHRALVTGLAGILAVLVAGIVVSLAFAVRAKRASDEATAIAEFLQEDVFGAIDGWDIGSRQIMTKDLLDKASKRVPDKLGNAPLVEASVWKTLGGLYLKVDAFEEAQDRLNRSLEIFTHELGRGNPRTLEVVDLLGQMYWCRWQYGEAELYLSEALAGKRRLLGSDDADTLKTMAWLGWACYGNGEATKAEQLLTEACETARRTLGDRDPTMVESMFYYGAALLLRGRYAEGIHTLEDALRMSEGVLNPAHPLVAFPTALLGRQYSRQGRYAEAENLLTKALKTAREAWGERNGGTYHNVAALAENYARQGRITDAETLLLDAVERGRQMDGLGSPIAINASYYLGFFYVWQRRFDEAERCIRPALQANIDSNGEQHSISWLGQMTLAMLYREQGRYDEADKQLEGPAAFVAVADKSVHVANAVDQLATLRQQQGRYAEAEALHLRVLSARRNLLVEDHPHILGTIRGLIALYTAWGKPQQAQQWFNELRTAYARRSAAAGDSPATIGTIHYDPVVGIYTLAAPPSPSWTIEKEPDFSYPEPSSEMWHVSDDLHFTYETLHGDGSITAKVENIAPAHYGTQVSVMIREGLDPTSPHASMVITPLGDIVFQYRTVELGAAQSRYATSRAELPHWIRLTRLGNLFTAQHSSDGVNWEDFQGSNLNQPNSIEIPMDETAYIGLALTSCDQSPMAETRISNVTVLGSVRPSGPFDTFESVSLGSLPSADRGESR
jgi:tetratricopeptide (TPR) repeat protein